MKKKILAIVSHPDDEIIGCGGTLIKHVKQKDQVKVVFTSESERARSKNVNTNEKNSHERIMQAKKISKKLGFKEPIFLNYPSLSLSRKKITEMNSEIQKIIIKFKPNVIYTHSPYDVHHDHRATFDATLVASRPSKHIKIEEILTFEIPSATEFSIYPNKKNFIPTCFVNIENHIKLKKTALTLYKKQLKDYPNMLSIKGIINLNSYRGNMVNLKYAEAFAIIRKVNY